MVRSSSIKKFGAKAYLAQEIISRFVPHNQYNEPYFCTGAVLFAKPPEWYNGVAEIVNDLDWDITNFWMVLQDESAFKKFKRLVEATPVNQALWEYYRTERIHLEDPDPRSALQFFIRCRQSREGKEKAFNTLTKTRTRRGMQEQVSAWLTSIDGLLDAHTRLKRVLILDAQDAIGIIRRQDTAKTLHYLDPPYFHPTRVSKAVYRHEMTKQQHVDLLDELAKIKGKFILSAYQSNLYETWKKKHGFIRHDIEIDCKASSAKEKPKRVECLYMNYDPPVAA